MFPSAVPTYVTSSIKGCDLAKASYSPLCALTSDFFAGVHVTSDYFESTVLLRSSDSVFPCSDTYEVTFVIFSVGVLCFLSIPSFCPRPPLVTFHGLHEYPTWSDVLFSGCYLVGHNTRPCCYAFREVLQRVPIIRRTRVGKGRRRVR